MIATEKGVGRNDVILGNMRIRYRIPPLGNITISPKFAGWHSKGHVISIFQKLGISQVSSGGPKYITYY